MVGLSHANKLEKQQQESLVMQSDDAVCRYMYMYMYLYNVTYIPLPLFKDIYILKIKGHAITVHVVHVCTMNIGEAWVTSHNVLALYTL